MNSGDPLPGPTRDAAALPSSGVLAVVDFANAIGDNGYPGTRLFGPYGKASGGDFHDRQEVFRDTFHSACYVFEQEITVFQVRRIMHSDRRRAEDSYTAAF